VLCHLRIEGINRVGLLRDVTGVVSDSGFNIGNLRSEDDGEDHSVIQFFVEVPDLFSLSPLLNRIKQLPGIVDAIHMTNVNE
jgi:(p)ppGpp synthase/HD superfamily hydrolase